MKLKKGFTLIELLVVVAIIGVLATIVLASLSSARSSARDARRHADIKTIQNQLEIYYLDHGEYPIRGWQFSYNSGWDTLSSLLGVELPKDPINEASQPYSGGSSYAYNSSSSSYTGCPNGQWYVLLYVPERTIDPNENIGVARCNSSSQRKWGNNSITVGRSPVQ